jgi:hypothetical protein
MATSFASAPHANKLTRCCPAAVGKTLLPAGKDFDEAPVDEHPKPQRFVCRQDQRPDYGRALPRRKAPSLPRSAYSVSVAVCLGQLSERNGAAGRPEMPNNATGGSLLHA